MIGHGLSRRQKKLAPLRFRLAAKAPYPLLPSSFPDETRFAELSSGGIQGNGAGSLCQGKQSSLVSYLFTAGVIGSRSKSLNARLAILSDRFTRSLAK